MSVGVRLPGWMEDHVRRAVPVVGAAVRLLETAFQHEAEIGTGMGVAREDNRWSVDQLRDLEAGDRGK